MLRRFIISYFAPQQSAAPSAQVEGIASVVFIEIQDITHIKGCEGEVVQLLDTVFTSKVRGQGQKMAFGAEKWCDCLSAHGVVWIILHWIQGLLI